MQIEIGVWCNGNTTDSGPVILGSSPSTPTVLSAKLLKISTQRIFYKHNWRVFGVMIKGDGMMCI